MSVNMNLMHMGCVKVFSVKSSVIKVIILWTLWTKKIKMKALDYYERRLLPKAGGFETISVSPTYKVTVLKPLK